MISRLEPEAEDLGCFSLTTLDAATAATAAEDRGRPAELEMGLKRSPAVDPRKTEEEEGWPAFEARADLSWAKEAERIALMAEEREAADMVATRGGRERKEERANAVGSNSQEMKWGKRVGFNIGEEGEGGGAEKTRGGSTGRTAWIVASLAVGSPFKW